MNKDLSPPGFIQKKTGFDYFYFHLLRQVYFFKNGALLSDYKYNLLFPICTSPGRDHLVSGEKKAIINNRASALAAFRIRLVFRPLY